MRSCNAAGHQSCEGEMTLKLHPVDETLQSGDGQVSLCSKNAIAGCWFQVMEGHPPAVECNQCWKGAYGNFPATCQGGLQQKESRLSFRGGEVLVIQRLPEQCWNQHMSC